MIDGALHRSPSGTWSVSKATKDHASLKRLNDVLILLYEQNHYSPKALRKLRMLGEALEEKVLKPSKFRTLGEVMEEKVLKPSNLL